MLLLLSSAAGSGAASGDAFKPPNIVLVTIDTLRADHVGCYGGKYKTPTLDAIAAAGVRFERASTTAPITIVAHSSIMTGLYPFHHGVRANGFYTLPPEQTTLAEVLKESHYATAAFVSGFPLDHRFGLAQGFDVYDDHFTRSDGSGSAYDAERPAADTVRRALDFLQKSSKERFFLWVHLYDPHAEYAPPEPYKSRYATSPYDGEIAYADAELGRLWRALQPALDHTVLVVAGDHGESLGEHGERTHTIFVYDATVRVPLLIVGTGVAPHHVARSPVSLVDVFGTLVALGRGSASSDGCRLDGALEGRLDEGIPDRVLYFESYAPRLEFGWSQLLGVSHGDLKLIQAPEAKDVELYDTSSDPTETKDVASARPKDRDDLLGRLRGLLGGEGVGAQAPGTPLDPTAIEKLRSLGYLEGPPEASSSATALQSHGPLPAPRQMIASQPRIDNALRLMSHGKPAEAAAELQAVLSKDPANTFAAQVLASALAEQGDVAGALEALRRAISQAPVLTQAALLTSAGDLLRRQGKLADAEKELRRALELDPRNLHAMEVLAAALLVDGKLDAAESMLGNALRIDPSLGLALETRAEVALARGQGRQARADFEAALRADAKLAPTCWFGLARVAQAEGKRDEAKVQLRNLVGAASALTDADLCERAGTLAADLDELELAITLLDAARRLAPANASILRDLGVALSRAGRTDAAIAALGKARDAAPDDSSICNALGTAQARAGRMQEARASFEEALRLDPENALARENLEAARGALGEPGRR